MVRKTDVTKLAKKIIAYGEFEGDADPECGTCGGQGYYTWEHPHDGRELTATCGCMWRNRIPKPHTSADSDEVIALAKFWLEHQKK